MPRDCSNEPAGFRPHLLRLMDHTPMGSMKFMNSPAKASVIRPLKVER